LCCGLCGITNSIEQSHHWGVFYPGLPNTAFGNAVGFFIWIGFIGVVGSGLGIGLLLLLWPIIAINDWLKGSSKEPDGVQRLFDKEDAVDEDNPL